jgi:hypothetical protein
MNALERAALACERSGCTIAVTAADGQLDEDVSFVIDCPSHAHKVRLLQELAEIDAGDPWVRRRACQLAGDQLGGRLETLLTIHRYVRDGVVFVDEPVETFAPARQTLQWQIGDCDCSALALYALLRSLGYQVRMMTLGDPPTHVAVQVWWDGAWEWLETTLAADPGEHPVAARLRLGADDRKDIDR